ncbi:MAG: Ni/Fe hydrogenase subunit alpha [Hyphomicrobiales bacterium]
MIDGEVTDVRLAIVEPPRFFEALLRGRDFREAPDITARICGICPVAYQMSAVHAMEAACGIAVDGPLRKLRRLLYCGEWIQSHVLHIYMLHAPDFLGYGSVVEMARDHRAAVERGLRLKKAGNAIMALLGGRAIHPINVCVGGFYQVPKRRDLGPIAEDLKWAREAALETARWTSSFAFPDIRRDYELVALREEEGYPFNEGRIVSSGGLDLRFDSFEESFPEHQVGHSTALHARIEGRGAYLLGPLARYGLNYDRLSPVAREAAREAGLGSVCLNPFQSIVVRSIEVLHACDEALRLIENYEEPDSPCIDVVPRAGIGCWSTEAPRGLLYHRYQIAEDGTILTALIVPPTAQNQGSIEDDVRAVLAANLDLTDEALTARCEQAIRNYDPCISCATHFLKLDIDRAGRRPRAAFS